MASASLFQPTTNSFGQLTLHHGRRRAAAWAGVQLGRHRYLLIGWAFATVFLAGLGTLYALDQAVFAANDRPAVYGGVALDYD